MDMLLFVVGVGVVVVVGGDKLVMRKSRQLPDCVGGVASVVGGDGCVFDVGGGGGDVDTLGVGCGDVVGRRK